MAHDGIVPVIRDKWKVVRKKGEKQWSDTTAE